jgi:hypothetical protein
LLFNPTLIPTTAIDSSNDSDHNTTRKGATNDLNRSIGKNEKYVQGSSREGGQPKVVKYLTEFQDVYLPRFDPELSAHLGYFIVGLFCYISSFLFCAYFFLLMPYLL